MATPAKTLATPTENMKSLGFSTALTSQSCLSPQTVIGANDLQPFSDSDAIITAIRVFLNCFIDVISYFYLIKLGTILPMAFNKPVAVSPRFTVQPFMLSQVDTVEAQELNSNAHNIILMYFIGFSFCFFM